MPITVKASTRAIQEAKTNGDAENVPEGYHIFKLQKVEVGPSKAGNQQLTCSYKLVGLTRQGTKPDRNYWPVTDYVQLEGEETEWKRAEFLLAMGVDTAARGGNKLEIDAKKPGTVIGKLVICRVKNEDYKGEARPKVAKVLPYVEPVDGLDDVSDEGDIPDDEALDETVHETIVEETVVEETMDEPDTEDYAFVPWERDALKAAGKDTIREVAASYDIEIIKGMTVSDILDAIMEAQESHIAKMNADDAAEGGEILSDDEPF